jgi:cell division septum initiation protein DivIVA
MSEELTRGGESLFKLARRGYEREDVDAYVATLQHQIRELQAQLQQGPDPAVREALERVGVEVASVLQQAHDTAGEVVAQAEREAGEIVTQAEREAGEERARAKREAAHVTAVAEQRLHELDLDTDRIWGERERIVADARDLARQLIQLADQAAARFPSDGEATAALNARN